MRAGEFAVSRLEKLNPSVLELLANMNPLFVAGLFIHACTLALAAAPKVYVCTPVALGVIVKSAVLSLSFVPVAPAVCH
jgi:hypothetical protein